MSEDRNLISHLPPAYQFNPDELWNNLVTNFKTSFQNSDKFGIQKSISEFEYYTTTAKQYMNGSSDAKGVTKKRNLQILGPLFDFIVKTPFIDFSIQARAAKLFASLSKKKINRPDPSELHLSLEKVLNLFKLIFRRPHGCLVKSYPDTDLKYYIIFFSVLRYYFDDNDGDKLLETHIDKIGCIESNSIKSTLILLRFYPTTEKCFKAIFPHLVFLLNNPTITPVTCSVFQYISSVYNEFFCHKYFDWRPYVRQIFNIISHSLNSSVKVLGDNFRCEVDNDYPNDFVSQGVMGGYSVDSLAMYSCAFLPYFFVDFEEEKGDENTTVNLTMSALNDFVTAYIPMITPKSKKAKEPISFISNLIYHFGVVKNLIETHRAKSEEKDNNIRISEETCKKFAATVLPFVETALFNESHYGQIISSVTTLARLNYELIVNELLPFCLNNMVDAEMSTTSTICFKTIHYLLPALLCEEHIDENLQKIPRIIDGSLERCKNSLLKNYYNGISMLAKIAEFISIPSEKDMNSKLSIRQRMVATAMINSLEVVIKCHFDHNKPLITDQSDNPYNNILTGNTEKIKPTPIKSSTKDMKKQASKDLNKHFDCYFAAFDDSYIEKIVVPNVLKCLKSASNAAFLNKFTYTFTKYLSRIKPDLISKTLSPKLEEFFVKANITRKPFWAHLLSSTFVACPSFVEKISHYVELITNLLTIPENSSAENEKDEKDDKDDDEIECNFKCANVLIDELLVKVTGPTIIDWTNQEKSSDDSGIIKWGVLYLNREVHPKWYEIDQSIVNTTAESIYKALQPHLAKYPTYTLKKQKLITKMIYSFFLLFGRRGKFGQLEYNDHKNNATYTTIECSLFEFFNEMLSTLQTYQSKEEILAIIVNSIFVQSNYLAKSSESAKAVASQKYSYSSSESAFRSSRFYCLLSYYHQLHSSLYKYEPIFTPNIELISDKILLLNESDFSSISNRALLFFQKFTMHSKKIHEDYLLKQLDTLEKPDINEYQCKGALLYLANLSRPYYLNKPEFIVRLIKSIISLKYQKDWKITGCINAILFNLECIRNFMVIDESQVWRDFLNDFINLPRTIDPRFFHIIIRFIITQEPPPSDEIVKYIINSIRDKTDAHRSIAIDCILEIFYRIKPKAPRSSFKTVDEFKAAHSDIVPYVDKTSVGFHCKPAYYKFYTGPASFGESSKKYEGIIKYLKDEVFNSEQAFIDIFESFVLFHPKEDQPHFNPKLFDFWKGVSKLIGSSVVKYVKDYVLKQITEEAITSISPVYLTSLCELISGIARATKHWKPEEKKMAADELLIPACTTMIRLKGFDSSTSAVNAMVFKIVGDFDYRRVQWLYDIIEQILTECLNTKENINEIVLRGVLKIAITAYCETNKIFCPEFIRIMKTVVIPLFSDFKSFKLDFISNFANLISSYNTTMPQFCIDNGKDEDYYNAPSFSKTDEVNSLIVDVFDKHKEEPELVSLFLSEMIVNGMSYFSYFLKYIPDRFSDIILIDSKLVDISSGKFLHYGKNIICNLGFLPWANYKDKMNEALFDNIIKKQILSINRESLPWNTRANILGFLHTLTFSNLLVFSKKQFAVMADEVLPFFLADSNQEVRNAAKSLLKVLICVGFNDDWSICAQKVEHYASLSSSEKDKNKAQKNAYIAVSFACALLDNVYIWFAGYPDWLPGLFYLLENYYNRGDSSEEIKNSVNNFFTRHRGREIPEIEDYRYSFSEKYFA